jgi:hypothetical protein
VAGQYWASGASQAPEFPVSIRSLVKQPGFRASYQRSIVEVHLSDLGSSARFLGSGFAFAAVYVPGFVNLGFEEQLASMGSNTTASRTWERRIIAVLHDAMERWQ